MNTATLDQIKKEIISYMGYQGNDSVVTRLNDVILLAINDAVNEVAHMLKWNATTKEVSATLASGVDFYEMPEDLALGRIVDVHVKVEDTHWRSVSLEYDQERVYTEPQDTFFKRYERVEAVSGGRCDLRFSPPCIEAQEIKIKYIHGMPKLTNGCDVCPLPADLVKLYATYLLKVSQGANDAGGFLERFSAILRSRKAEYSNMPDIIKKKQSPYTII